jgi:hypothetical protein
MTGNFIPPVKGYELGLWTHGAVYCVHKCIMYGSSFYGIRNTGALVSVEDACFH